MATSRYARESRTSAQKSAALWQRKVEETERSLAIYARQIAEGRQLSQYDAMQQRNATRRLEKLLAENPNEVA